MVIFTIFLLLTVNYRNIMMIQQLKTKQLFRYQIHLLFING